MANRNAVLNANIIHYREKMSKFALKIRPMARKKKELPLLQGVEITGIAAEGRALARIQWRPEDESRIVLFVPYASVGDVADIQVDRKKHSFAEGHIVRLVKPSSARVEPRCGHFGLCGG